MAGYLAETCSLKALHLQCNIKLVSLTSLVRTGEMKFFKHGWTVTYLELFPLICHILTPI